MNSKNYKNYECLLFKQHSFEIMIGKIIKFTKLPELQDKLKTSVKDKHFLILDFSKSKELQEFQKLQVLNEKLISELIKDFDKSLILIFSSSSSP